MFGHPPRRPLQLLAITGLTLALTGLTTTPAFASDRHHADDRSSYQQLNEVSDMPGAAKVLDPNLVNAWGLAFGPTTPLWVSNNASNTSTLYQGTATPSSPVTPAALIVKIPGAGAPTGVVFNAGTGFALTTDGKSGPAKFIFAGENGQIFGWNPTGVDGTSATQAAMTANAVYKGLAMVTVNQKQYLLAANFHDNRIDVFNDHFAPVMMHHAFASVGIPKGYAPFDVALLGNRVFVSYAKQDAARHDDVAGAGHGFVNVFSTSGRFLDRFSSRGVLNSPWGLAIAPKGFGEFSGDVLVGNFGDGRIHAFDPRSGELEGTLRTSNGKPIVIDGLWGLLPGNGTAGQTSDVWFSAGPNGETHGLLGILRASGRTDHDDD
ncbi:MAG TPA: TIGR03118 family protein [Jatrophihabitans sp.]|jgi:uncharacterized protein (TIGR03118 family)